MRPLRQDIMTADELTVDFSAATDLHGNNDRGKGFPVDVVSSNIHS